MKPLQIFLIYLMIISSELVYSQTNDSKKNLLRFETGYIIQKPDGLTGHCFNYEYSRLIGGKFKISPSIGYTNLRYYALEKINQDRVTNVNNTNFELTGYYTPVEIFKLIKFEIGLGGYFSNKHTMTANNDYIVSTPSGPVGVSAGYYLHDQDIFGYLLSLGTLVNLNKTLDLNLRGIYLHEKWYSKSFQLELA